MITSATKLNAVIGFPLDKSHSPILHNSLYHKLGIDAVLLALPHKNITSLVTVMKTTNIGLCVVTMPFKQTIIPFLDKLDKQARAIGAVNTVINKGGFLSGFNTDIDGLAFALRPVPMEGKNVLLLGAGGAARAAAYYCKKRGSKILYLNRTLSKAEQLRKEFGGTIVSMPRLKADDIDVIINATSVGMYPKVHMIPLPTKFLRKGQYVFDVVYNEGQTEFLKQAKNKGAKIISGMDMFIGQAIKQIEIYSGKSLQNQEILHYAKKIVTKNI